VINSSNLSALFLTVSAGFQFEMHIFRTSPSFNPKFENVPVALDR